MNTLIIYGSNSGGTLEASEIIRDVFTNAGHAVTLLNAKDAQPADIAGHQLVIFGSCTWELIQDQEQKEGRLQQDWLEFQKRLVGIQAPNQRFAVFGLGDSSYGKFCASADDLEKIVQKLGGKKVGSTLKIDGFYFHPDARQQVATWATSLLQL